MMFCHGFSYPNIPPSCIEATVPLDGVCCDSATGKNLNTGSSVLNHIQCTERSENNTTWLEYAWITSNISAVSAFNVALVPFGIKICPGVPSSWEFVVASVFCFIILYYFGCSYMISVVWTKQQNLHQFVSRLWKFEAISDPARVLSRACKNRIYTFLVHPVNKQSANSQSGWWGKNGAELLLRSLLSCWTLNVFQARAKKMVLDTEAEVLKKIRVRLWWEACVELSSSCQEELHLMKENLVTPTATCLSGYSHRFRDFGLGLNGHEFNLICQVSEVCCFAKHEGRQPVLRIWRRFQGPKLWIFCAFWFPTIPTVLTGAGGDSQFRGSNDSSSTGWWKLGCRFPMLVNHSLLTPDFVETWLQEMRQLKLCHWLKAWVNFEKNRATCDSMDGCLWSRQCDACKDSCLEAIRLEAAKSNQQSLILCPWISYRSWLQIVEEESTIAQGWLSPFWSSQNSRLWDCKRFNFHPWHPLRFEDTIVCPIDANACGTSLSDTELQTTSDAWHLLQLRFKMSPMDKTAGSSNLKAQNSKDESAK